MDTLFTGRRGNVLAVETRWCQTQKEAMYKVQVMCARVCVCSTSASHSNKQSLIGSQDHGDWATSKEQAD